MTFEKTKLTWAYEDYALINWVYDKNDLKIFILENLEHNYHFLKYFKRSNYLLIMIGCYFDEWNFNFTHQLITNEFDNIDPNKVIYLCNEEAQLKSARKSGFDCILFNHNCLVNRDLFRVDNHGSRIYDMVINTRPENIKRPWLAKNINNLAVIKGANYFPDRFWDLEQLNPTYINTHRLLPKEVNKIYNNSHVGGIFSEREGANFSTGEYLCSGLPVVSTHSLGGRSLWFNELNSKIIEPQENEVLFATNDFISKLRARKITHMDIRFDFLNQVEKQKSNLFLKFSEIFDFEKVYDVNVNNVVDNLFSNKPQKVIERDYIKFLGGMTVTPL